MRKILTAWIAIMGFAAQAHAAGGVRIYGLLDEGFTTVSNVRGAQVRELQDGVNHANQLGVLGSEEIGGGDQVIFKLENGPMLNTGGLRGNLLFGNQSWVGLRDAHGDQITAGRQYDFMTLMEGYLPCLQCGLYVVQNADFDRLSGERINESVQAISGNLGGWRLGVMYGFPQTGTPTTVSNFGRAYSAVAQYRNGGFSAAVATTDINGALTYAPLLGAKQVLGVAMAGLPGLVVNNQDIWALGGQYRIEHWTATALYTRTRLTLGALSSLDQTWRLGGAYTFAPRWSAMAQLSLDRFEGSQWRTLNLGLQHPLSKRVSMYLDLATQRATGAGSVASIPLTGLSSSSAQSLARVGMLYSF